MTEAQPQTIYLKNYQPFAFNVESIYLHFDLHDGETIVKSILSFTRNSKATAKARDLRLDGEELELQQIFLDGKSLSADAYRVDPQGLTVLNVPDQFKLETVVRINPAENKALSGLYLSRRNYCTQCEAQGFRRITYFPDRPDVMTRFSTTICADKSDYPMLLSNGNLVEERQLEGNRHWVHWEDPAKKPCYLFALVAGEFDLLQDEFTTFSGRKVALNLYLEQGFRDQGSFALQALKKAMRWDEEKFGREYDLDIYMIVAVSDFNMGAMENKGLNIFNTKYILAKPETATDSDYVAIEGVIGHEYFHNWTGNRITCRDWFQLTLKEGLTVYRDERFTEDMTSKGVTRIEVSNVVRNAQFPEDAGPMAHPIRPESYIEINNFYTNTVYRKGAEVIRMIHTLIGDQHFRQGMDLYFERHDGQAVTTEDFVQALQDASGMDLTQFKRWYNQAGTPVLEVSSKYDAKRRLFTLKIEQSCPSTPGQKRKEPFCLPLAVGLISKHCKDLPTQLQNEASAVDTDRVLVITKPKQEFHFINVTERPVPSLLRGFSAPVRLKYDYTDEELLWLLQCDSDAFSRYEAGQNYLQRLIFKMVDKKKGAETSALINTYRAILTKGETDLQCLAYLLSLPGFHYLLQHDSTADIDTVHVAREVVKTQLANNLSDLWLEVYRKNTLAKYEFTLQDMGKRAIKNLALAYLTATQKPDYFSLAYEQFSQADNMTDVMGALYALNNYDCKERSKALEEFYQRWQSQPLVVNKWLLLQASSLLPSTLETVRTLLSHPAFEITNPNNVYSLIGGFTQNKLRFHANTGAGYALVTDLILKVDPMNPQVAARMLQPFTQWQQYDKVRQKLMKAELQRILTNKKLSKDVYELASKSLNPS